MREPVPTKLVAIFPVKVLFVSTSVVSFATKVLVPVGNVIVPEFEKFVAILPDNVLFVNTSVVSLPTNVQVAVGSVIVPVFEIADIAGLVENVFVPNIV